MSWSEKKIKEMVEENESLKKELNSMQFTLGFVLQEVGEPVIITRETLENGLPEGAGIQIQDDMRSECIVISLVKDKDG